MGGQQPGSSATMFSGHRGNFEKVYFTRFSLTAGMPVQRADNRHEIRIKGFRIELFLEIHLSCCCDILRHLEKLSSPAAVINKW